MFSSKRQLCASQTVGKWYPCPEFEEETAQAAQNAKGQGIAYQGRKMACVAGYRKSEKQGRDSPKMRDNPGAGDEFTERATINQAANPIIT